MTVDLDDLAKVMSVSQARKCTKALVRFAEGKIKRQVYAVAKLLNSCIGFNDEFYQCVKQICMFVYDYLHLYLCIHLLTNYKFRLISDPFCELLWFFLNKLTPLNPVDLYVSLRNNDDSYYL